MSKMKFLDMFIEDCKYYDSKKIELNTILKRVDFRGKTVLDIGAGIGRLSFPIAKYAKEVIALDKDKRFREYFKRHKTKNVVFVNQDAEIFLKKGKKFDIVLLAWPTLNFKLINLIKNAMHKDSLFIFITCDNKSDFEMIVNKLKFTEKGFFDKDIQNKMKFIKLLPKKFKVLSKKKISVPYVYPNKKIAFETLKITLKLWFNIKLNKKSKERLSVLVDKHRINNKVKFGEKIWFYVLKLK